MGEVGGSVPGPDLLKPQVYVGEVLLLAFSWSKPDPVNKVFCD